MAQHYDHYPVTPITQIFTVRYGYFHVNSCEVISTESVEKSIRSRNFKASPNSNGVRPTNYDRLTVKNTPGPYVDYDVLGGQRELWRTGDAESTIFDSETAYSRLMRIACENSCAARAVDRFYASFSDANWAETILEYRQVRKMFSLTNNLGPLFKRAARRWGGTAVAGSLWLQTHFGLKPLVSDIFSTLEAIARQTASVYSVAGSASDSYIHYPHWSPSQGVRVNVRVRFHARMQNGHFDLMTRLTSMDPARWLWESIPLSMVADWFLNVGGYLQQIEMNAMYAKAFVSGTTSIRKSAKGSAVYHSGQYPGLLSCMRSQEYGIWGGSGELDSYSRRVINQLPRPTPSPPVALGARQLIHAYAMMTQALPWKDVHPPRWVSFGPDGKRRR